MGEIEIGELKIEWDDNKNVINKKKHGISFETAANVFLDENLYIDYDEFHNDDEDRWKVVGMVNNILAVIYTERGEKYRLISARPATKKERNDYYGQFYN